MREGDALVSRLDDQVAAASARLQLQQALAGNWAEVEFKKIKDMKAPAAGRVFYLNGWNDQTDQVGKFSKEMYVWGGLSVAEILDMSHLSFRAELPEARYRRLTVGQAVELRFPLLDERTLAGRIASLGRAFHRPKDVAGAPTIADERDFSITVDFEPPPELQDVLVPGTAGAVTIVEGKAP
jgi:hypothetical protein